STSARRRRAPTRSSPSNNSASGPISGCRPHSRNFCTRPARGGGCYSSTHKERFDAKARRRKAAQGEVHSVATDETRIKHGCLRFGPCFIRVHPWLLSFS